MTVDYKWDDALNDISKRLYELEMHVSGTVAPQSATASSGILPVGTSIGGVPLAGDISPVTNLEVVPAALYEKSYADISFDPPAVGHAAFYEIEISEYNDSGGPPVLTFWRSFNFNTTTPRIYDLVPGTEYSVVVRAVNIVGVRSDPTPDNGADDYVTFVAAADQIVPHQVENFNLYSGLRQIIAIWDDVEDDDVNRGRGQYEVQISQTTDFASHDSYFTTAAILAIPNTTAGETYYGRVRAIDFSGNEGAWSIYDTVVSGQAETGDIGNGVIVSDHIVVAGLDAAVIKFGQMLGDRIQANTLDAIAIKTSSLTAANITLSGGSLKAGNPPVNGVVFNSQGIRSYKDSDLVCVIDSNGDATFNNVTVTGIFQTDTTGSRVRIREDSPGDHVIEFYSGDVVETNPATIRSDTTSFSGGLKIRSRSTTTRPAYASFAVSADDGAFGYYVETIANRVNYYKSTGLVSSWADLGQIFALDHLLMQGQIYIDQSYPIDHSSGIAPLRVGDDTGPHLLLGQTNIIAKSGFSSIDTLDLNKTSTGPANGVRMGGYAFAGRLKTTDSDVQFSHYNFRGNINAAGLRQNAAGETVVCGTPSVAIRWDDSEWHQFLINSSGIHITGDQISLPDMPYSAGAGGNFVGIDPTYSILYRYSSSIRGKCELMDLEADDSLPGRTILERLRVKTYESMYTDGPGPDVAGVRYYGLIAEEVAQVAPPLCIMDKDGNPDNVAWTQIWPLMLAELQDLRREVELLKEG